jgi:hypothetical protein
MRAKHAMMASAINAVSIRKTVVFACLSFDCGRFDAGLVPKARQKRRTERPDDHPRHYEPARLATLSPQGV